MAELPLPPDAGVDSGYSTFCMDTREVTESDYNDWFITIGPNPPQDPTCYVSDFHPHDTTEIAGCTNFTYDPVGQPNIPIQCVDYCQAKAYCAWAGKELCAAFVPPSGDITLQSQYTRWSWACSNAGATFYEWGNVLQDGTCVDRWFDGGDGKQIVRPPETATMCHGTAQPFSRVYDLIGNVGEWQGHCDSQLYCLVAGGSAFTDPLDCIGGAAGKLHRTQFGEGLGFRCCAE